MLAVGPVSAQVRGNQLQSISYGEPLVAYLTPSDDTLADGSFYRSFAFRGQIADTITVTLESIDFDAVLLLADSSGVLLSPGGSDDNGGGRCNAHLAFVIPESGAYRLLATTSYTAEVGEFRVSLERGARPAPSTEECRGFFDTRGTLSIGDSVVGRLGPPQDAKLGPSYYQAWDLAIPHNQTVTVDLASEDFDPQLTLYRGFRTPVDANDDGGGGCTARLVLTGRSHPYRVVLTTGKEDEVGRYVLSMLEDSLPVMKESQCYP
jgi:serine protease Do